MKPCVRCNNGILKPGKVNFTSERNEVLVVIRNVPALVCDVCGEDYCDEMVTEKLLAQVDEAVSTGEKVLIREYIAA